MVNCAVPNCCSSSNKLTKSNGIGFHRFPKDAKVIEVWETAINRPNWSANAYSRICSKHFKDHCFYIAKDGSRQLRQDVYPTELLENKSSAPPKPTIDTDPDLQYNDTDSESVKRLKSKLIRVTEIAEQRKKRMIAYSQSKRRLLEKILVLRKLLKSRQKNHHNKKRKEVDPLQ